MPTYQYACTVPACGSQFELVQSFTDPNASACPTCGGAVRKVFSAVGVMFKGSGFYRNDSRKPVRDGALSDSDSSAKAEPPRSDKATTAGDSSPSSTESSKSAKGSDSSKASESSSSSGSSSDREPRSSGKSTSTAAAST